jgi:hypothetical protein
LISNDNVDNGTDTTDTMEYVFEELDKPFTENEIEMYSILHSSVNHDLSRLMLALDAPFRPMQYSHCIVRSNSTFVYIAYSNCVDLRVSGFITDDSVIPVVNLHFKIKTDVLLLSCELVSIVQFFTVGKLKICSCHAPLFVDIKLKGLSIPSVHVKRLKVIQ